MATTTGWTNGRRSGTGFTKVMYNWRVAAVHNALVEAGKESGDLCVEDLTALGHLDQYHYLSLEADDHVIEVLGLDDSVNVLDVGSGLGGPSRYIAAKTGCRVTGVELQEDLYEACVSLTSRIPQIRDKVSFIRGDFLELARDNKIPPDSFDHFISMLVFLHIPDRKELLKACYDVLRPGGTFLIEDFMIRLGRDLTEQENSWLRDIVYAPTVSTAQEYADSLIEAGFVDVDVVDMSDTWQAWTKSRHCRYVESREKTIKLHGEEIYKNAVKFYGVVDCLYAGNLGGCRITGRKPSELETRLLAGRRKDLGAGFAPVCKRFGEDVEEILAALSEGEK